MNPFETMNSTERELITSPYRRGADDGFIFGIYLTIMFFGSIFAGVLPLLGLLSLVMMVAVPVVIFLFIRRYDRQMNGCASFPMMWMQGVMIFLCGSLITGALLVIYLKWLDPEFMVRQLRQLVELGAGAPGTPLAEAADVASQMLETNFIPTPMAVVTEFIMGAVASGSILTILISSGFALRNKLRRRRGQTPPSGN